jgi:ParB-like chromosome segregation protein Spo0J
MTTTEAPPSEIFDGTTPEPSRSQEHADTLDTAPETVLQNTDETEQEHPQARSEFGTLRVRLIPEALDTVPVITGPFQVMPPPTLDEYRALVESIAANGVRVPILVDENGKVIDGHYRMHVAKILGIDPNIETLCPGLTDEEKIALAYALNVSRRHLTTAARKALAAQSIKRQPELSDSEHARRCNLSDKTVTNVRKDLEAHSEIPSDVPRIDTRGRMSPPNKAPAKAPAAPKVTPEEKRAERVREIVNGICTMTQDYTSNIAKDIEKLDKAALNIAQADALDRKAIALRDMADKLSAAVRKGQENANKEQ